MDYTTSHVFFLVSLGLFTVVLFSLALLDRSVIGARWLAASTLLDFTKTTLQGMNGHAPRFVTVLIANELNILSFVMMFLGLRWFIVRRPFRHGTAMASVGVVMVIYLSMYLSRMRLWSFSVGSLPVLGMCIVLAWTLFRQKDRRIAIPARITATLLTIHTMALAYRSVLSWRGLSGASAASPWSNPQWMYSMLAIMLVSYCLLLMYVLFTVMEMHSSVAHAAGVDALTGAVNRRALIAHATRELVRSDRLGRSLAIVAMDLDDFKRVNDTHGHGGGDVALCAFVDLVKERLRPEDMIARIGGEEFVLMLPGMDAVEATLVAEEVRYGLEQMRIHYDSKMIFTTVSAGVTEMQPGDSWIAMLKRADCLLYQAKAEGRNRVVMEELPVHYPKPVLVERFGVQRVPSGRTANTG